VIFVQRNCRNASLADWVTLLSDDHPPRRNGAAGSATKRGNTTARETITTKVAIMGAGPAVLTLSHLLAKQGIESTVVEIRSRQESRKQSARASWSTAP
jgi:hypothetical protein